MRSFLRWTRWATLLASGLMAASGILTPAGGHEKATHAGPSVRVPADGRITVIAKEFKFIPDALRVEKGQHVTIVFKNEGVLSHNLTIPDLGLHTPTEQHGSTYRLEFVAKKTGTYRFWCAVPGHKQAGMVGDFTVLP